jgi:hypothetical protein
MMIKSCGNLIMLIGLGLFVVDPNSILSGYLMIMGLAIVMVCVMNNYE